MTTRTYKRLPRHIGFIPDGNRRWARQRGLHPREGYRAGVAVGVELLRECKAVGIDEVSIYGFTQDNNKRAKDQRVAFGEAVVLFAEAALAEGIALRVVGEHASTMFPAELLPQARERSGESIKVNLLGNYGWEWELRAALSAAASMDGGGHVDELLASADVSRIDVIVRWGGMRRLSGFLPVQSVYADFYVIDALWPDFETRHFHEALCWYQEQDVTLGG